MRLWRRVLLAVILMAWVGCGGSSRPTGDAGPGDGAARDATVRDAGPDGGSDAEPGDAGKEAAVDGGADATPDAPSDGGTDAASDAALDAPSDGGTDAATDAGGDGMGPLPRHCAEILAADPGAADGTYLVDPDGEGPGDPVMVRCDMSTDGGGWTLCAVSDTNTAREAHGWGSATEGNWFACDALMADDGTDELLARSEGGGATYVDRFRGVRFGERVPSAAGAVFLTVFRDRASCGGELAGNFQWVLSSPVEVRYGLSGLQDGCGSAAPVRSWLMVSPGTVGPGCASSGQIVPNLGYPCGSYGDVGARMSLWHRPGSPPPPLPRHCAEILAADPSAADGSYVVDVDGAGPLPPQAVQCDMSTDGGGWTLCASSESGRALVAGWRSRPEGNWFACDALMADDGTDALLVRSEGGGATYVDRFDGVRFGARTPAVDGPVLLTVHRDQAACAVAAPDNFQWLLESPAQRRYGIDRLRDGCGSAAPQRQWMLISPGTRSNGCASSGQLTPSVAHPCNSYGDLGARMSLWHRPGSPPPPLPRHCAGILAADPSAADGFYVVDVDGAGPLPPHVVQCDMSTDGGGWTLCASSESSRALVTGWRSRPEGNWFACDALMADDGTDELLARSEGGGATYVDRFRGVRFGAAATEADGLDVSLKLWRDQATCNTPAPGNFQWVLSSETVLRYGVATLRNGCSGSSAPPNWTLITPGTRANGCATSGQLTPALAYPCGSYGAIGAASDLWHRPEP